MDLRNTHNTTPEDEILQGHASPPEKCCCSNDDPAADGSHPALPVASLDDASQPEHDVALRLPGRNDDTDCGDADNSTEDEPDGNENVAGDPQRASMTGAVPRVVAHLKSQRNQQSLTKTWPSPSLGASKNKQMRGSAKKGGPGGGNDSSHSSGPKKITRARSFFDPEAEARKAEERLVARRKQKIAEEQAAADEEVEKRRAAQARKTQAAQDKEARRLRIYACNAILTQNEWANIELVMKMMRDAEASEAAGATAEMLAEMATNSV